MTTSNVEFQCEERCVSKTLPCKTDWLESVTSLSDVEVHYVTIVKRVRLHGPLKLNTLTLSTHLHFK